MTRRGTFYAAAMLVIAGCGEGENESVGTIRPQLPVVRNAVVNKHDVEPLPEPVIAPIPLEHLGPADLVDVILDASTSESTRLRAAGRLGRIGSAAASEVSRLEPALHTEIADVQLASAIALVGIDHQDDSPIPILTAALENKDSQVRIAVLNTLTSLGERGQPAAGAIIASLSDEHAKVCETAVFALYSVGLSEEHLPALLTQLESDKARPHVLDVIASMRKNATAAVPHLVKLLGTGDELTQRRLRDALAAIGKAAIPSLTELIADDQADESRRIAAVAVLGTMGRTVTDALPELQAARKIASPRFDKAIRAAIVLIKGGDQ